MNTMTNNDASRASFEDKAAPKSGAIREFAHYYRPHLGMFLLDMACASVISLVDIFFPVFTRQVLYDYIPNQLMRTFVLMALLMLGLFLLRTAAQFAVMRTVLMPRFSDANAALGFAIGFASLELIVGGISCILSRALFAALPKQTGQQRRGSPFQK